MLGLVRGFWEEVEMGEGLVVVVVVGGDEEEVDVTEAVGE